MNLALNLVLPLKFFAAKLFEPVATIELATSHSEIFCKKPG